jgi:hypothetical protein
VNILLHLFTDPKPFSPSRIGIDTYALLPTLYNFKLYITVGRGKKGIISSHSDVDSRVETSSSLSDQDVAGANFLSAEPFDAQPLRLAVTTVSARPAAFLMSHRFPPDAG